MLLLGNKHGPFMQYFHKTKCLKIEIWMSWFSAEFSSFQLETDNYYSPPHCVRRGRGEGAVLKSVRSRPFVILMTFFGIFGRHIFFLSSIAQIIFIGLVIKIFTIILWKNEISKNNKYRKHYLKFWIFHKCVMKFPNKK